ncbi:MAG: hypothetical protein JNL16_00255 [Dechloromonas sp.]|nr:hypothetical protein [Dechloromonas sp.]
MPDSPSPTSAPSPSFLARPQRVQAGTTLAAGNDGTAVEEAHRPNATSGETAATRAVDNGQLSAAELAQLRQLQQTDRRVRAHEMAHVVAGGSLVRSGASFIYATGPDGRRHAVAGEVGIDTSPGRTPLETLDKANRIKAAALAPADPSPQDRQVAALATRMAMQASMQRSMQRNDEGAPAATTAGQPATAATPAVSPAITAYAGSAPAAGESGSMLDLFA